nr:RHS repeat-associated core domain-containing protein [Paracidovorax avenae]
MALLAEKDDKAALALPVMACFLAPGFDGQCTFDGPAKTLKTVSLVRTGDWVGASWLPVFDLQKVLARGHWFGRGFAFAYDLLGRMLQAGNADARVHFAYDPLSRLVEEVQEHLAPEGAGTLGRYAWRHAYDALGNRTDSRMPGGRHVQWLYYGSGHLHQIRVDGHVLSDIERDALHQEIERTQGALESRYGWDSMGRLVAHKVGRRQALQGLPGMPSPQALRDRDQGLPAMPNLPSGDRIARQYRYDPTGNLIATRDGLRGDSHYRYDPLGRILAAQRGDGKQQATERETFAFDPAGNLLNPNRGAGPQASGGVGQRDVVPHNRLAVYQDLRFAYDLHGNVTERRIGWHTVQHYRYSPEHQIVEARVVRYRDRPAEGHAEPAATEQATHYRYDALGRRIEKRDAFGRTAFLYDGDLLAGELRGSRLSEYLYEPDSFVPLAKMESEWKGLASEKEREQARADAASQPEEQARPKDFTAYYYQCDQIGAPQELTDEQGRIVWAASYQVWGQTQALQVMRTGTDDAAVFTRAERPLALAAKGDIQALSFVEQPLRFQGQYFDGETGLHYNRFRYYDPVTGRFVHQDPIGLVGGNNVFFYAPNPLTWSDPLGLKPKRCGCRPDPCGIAKHGHQPSPRPNDTESHHIIQDAWAKNQIGKQGGYSTYGAPAILLQNGPHDIANAAQNARRDARLAAGMGKWESPLRDEFDNASRDLRAAGVSEKCRKRALKKAYQYFYNRTDE